MFFYVVFYLNVSYLLTFCELAAGSKQQAGLSDKITYLPTILSFQSQTDCELFTPRGCFEYYLYIIKTR